MQVTFRSIHYCLYCRWLYEESGVTYCTRSSLTHVCMCMYCISYLQGRSPCFELPVHGEFRFSLFRTPLTWLSVKLTATGVIVDFWVCPACLHNTPTDLLSCLISLLSPHENLHQALVERTWVDRTQYGRRRISYLVGLLWAGNRSP